MSLQCSNPACNGEIKRGERYVAIDFHTERVGRFGKVKVEYAELMDAYHLGCVPKDRGR